jgi:hypothetical protein
MHAQEAAQEAAEVAEAPDRLNRKRERSPSRPPDLPATFRKPRQLPSRSTDVDLLKIAEHVACRESMAFDKQDAFIWNVRLQTGKQ